SNFRIEDLLRDVSASVGRGFTPRQSDEIAQAVTRASERSRIFFSALSMARMEAAESKARYTSETFVDYFQDGAMLAGALEALEASLALAADPKGPRRSDGEPTEEVLATLARRARDLYTD